MKKNEVVHFVCFETSVDLDEFVLHWEPDIKLLSDDKDITLQKEAEKKGRFRYLTQHRCNAGDFEFLFKRKRKAPQFPEIDMRVREAGGYTPIQIQKNHGSEANENKIFVFINTALPELEDFRQLPNYEGLNIYQAYYESCIYTYILEFFIKDDQVAEFTAHLKNQSRPPEIGIYKEYRAEKKQKRKAMFIR